VREARYRYTSIEGVFGLNPVVGQTEDASQIKAFKAVNRIEVAQGRIQ
jgi:hypothetical protein